MVTIANWLIDLIYTIIMGLLDILPDSPFRFTLDDNFKTYIAYVNYFIPVGTLIAILVTFTTAVGVWYGIRWLMRIVRYIQ